MKNFKKNTGFIKIIFIVVAALVVMKYIYNIDIIGFLTQGRFRDLLDKVYEFGSIGWGKYRDIIIKILEYIKNIIR
jgi:hypothetical protein